MKRFIVGLSWNQRVERLLLHALIRDLNCINVRQLLARNRRLFRDSRIICCSIGIHDRIQENRVTVDPCPPEYTSVHARMTFE